MRETFTFVPLNVDPSLADQESKAAIEEIFHFDGIPSPDLSLDIALMRKHHSAFFAVLLAYSIGYFDPLVARLSDPSVGLEPYERAFLATNWGKPIKGGGRKVDMYRNRLRIAAHYLESDRGDPGEGKKIAAERFAAAECGLNTKDTGEVRRAVRFARRVHYGPWSWWDIAAQMARKGKIEQLHRTY
jgi:hypothetical protein